MVRGVVTAVVFGWNLLWSWVVLVQWGLIPSDAAARSLLAAQVWFSRDPKLVNLGFVWLPLPGLLGLPLTAIPGLWQRGLAQAAVSAMSGARAPQLVGSGAGAGGWGRARAHRVAAFALHPVTVFLSATGLSEMVFFAAALAQLRCLVGWWDAVGQGSRRVALEWLVGLGLAAAAGGLTRYEGWVLAGFVVLLVTLRLWQKGLGPDHWQASLVVVGAAPLYAALFWVFSNWLILGDPWYFARGPYAAAAEAAAAAGTVTGWPSVVAIVLAGWQLWPPFWAAWIATFLVGIARRDGRLLALSAFWSVLVGFYALALGVGPVAFLQYRYLGFIVPAGLTLVAAVLGAGRARPTIQALAGLGLVVTGPLVGLGGMLADPAPIGNSMRPVAETVLGRPVGLWAAERAMADYLRTTRGPFLPTATVGSNLCCSGVGTLVASSSPRTAISRRRCVRLGGGLPTSWCRIRRG